MRLKYIDLSRRFIVKIKIMIFKNIKKYNLYIIYITYIYISMTYNNLYLTLTRNIRVYYFSTDR